MVSVSCCSPASVLQRQRPAPQVCVCVCVLRSGRAVLRSRCARRRVVSPPHPGQKGALLTRSCGAQGGGGTRLQPVHGTAPEAKIKRVTESTETSLLCTC